MTHGCASLLDRGLRPVAQLAAERPHGSRLRYLAGCKCADCRRANTAYERHRLAARKTGDWNGIVDAAEARQHILALSRQGIGRRSVAAASDVAQSIVAEIRAGTRTQIRVRTARRILAVTRAAVADRALVPAARTWRLIDELLEEGFTTAFLARELGYERPVLQFNRKRVTAANQLAVEKLHRRLTS